MKTSSIITDLISDDSYLLWEIRAAVHSELGCGLSEIIEEAIALVVSRQAQCRVGPVISTSPLRKIGAEEAIQALKDDVNWQPPASDDIDAIWLEGVSA